MKQVLKKAFAVLCVLIVLWLIPFSVDYQRAARRQEPVFAIPDGSPSANTAVICTGLGYTVKCGYDSRGMLQDTALYLLGTFLTGCTISIPL